jgi:DNA repair protein RecO (recombination protein O)
MDRYTAASALAEVTLRFTSSEPHPEVFDFLTGALDRLETAAVREVPATGIRLLWGLAGILGFAPSLEDCARDGAPVPEEGALVFSAEDGGALCPRCARERQAAQLPAGDRADLAALLAPDRPLPPLDERHAAAHRRLLTRYVRYHLGEGAALPGLEFWCARSWSAA